jgi:hypothetical protein
MVIALDLWSVCDKKRGRVSDSVLRCRNSVYRLCRADLAVFVESVRVVA